MTDKSALKSNSSDFEAGALVSFWDREWLVLPKAKDNENMLLKPLGGQDAEIICLFPELIKNVKAAAFPLPDPDKMGDAASCALLRDSIRLGLRSATGPFRSFAHIAVDPRPYQLVPLLLALRQDVVRLLIADDVGIGKTVESLLIAREFLDRGEIKRLSVLCPPQLAEQWQTEMAEKFHIDAELVLPSTVHKLERGLSAGTSLFEKYPFTIVSLDYIKSEYHRNEFIRACPEFVIVDEAHSCAQATGAQSIQRHKLVSELAKDDKRHMLFVTATPHSGKEEQFRSLLKFLNPRLGDLPDDLTGDVNKQHRAFLASYFVQRRRGDINDFANTKTPFPSRISLERAWQADQNWTDLFNQAMAVAHKNIEKEKNSSAQRKRSSFWAALALLRAISSSPAAAYQALTTKAAGTNPEEELTSAQIEEISTQSLMDLDNSNENTILDTMPGADLSAFYNEEQKGLKGPYAELAQKAISLKGKNDSKLKALISEIKTLLKDSFSPVIFCRFIPTAEYLAQELRKELPNAAIESITGLIPPADRKERVQNLGKTEKRILICTDCLSEGINLQHDFNAVIHYDLAWNPTRHEQREGRVDRFGQSMPKVRALTFYGKDNPMDGMVLDVLLRKHEEIRKSLGISVPIPKNSEELMQTLIQGLLIHGNKKIQTKKQLLLPGLDSLVEAEKNALATEWEKVKEKELKRSHTLFAHQSIKSEEVAKSLEDASAVYGASQTVEDFVSIACERLGAKVLQKNRDGQKIYNFTFDDISKNKYSALHLPDSKDNFVFDLPAKEGQSYLGRTHPFVEALAAYIAENALDDKTENLVPRAGLMRTSSVQKLSAILLCRFRFEIETKGEKDHSSLAEECLPLAFKGLPQRAEWLDEEAVSRLLKAQPAENISSDDKKFIINIEEGINELLPHIKNFQKERAEELLNAHKQYRKVSKEKNLVYKVRPLGEPDILGIFVYLPSNNY